MRVICSVVLTNGVIVASYFQSTIEARECFFEFLQLIKTVKALEHYIQSPAEVSALAVLNRQSHKDKLSLLLFVEILRNFSDVGIGFQRPSPTANRAKSDMATIH